MGERRGNVTRICEFDCPCCEEEGNYDAFYRELVSKVLEEAESIHIGSYEERRRVYMFDFRKYLDVNFDVYKSQHINSAANNYGDFIHMKDAVNRVLLDVFHLTRDDVDWSCVSITPKDRQYSEYPM